MAIVEPDLKRDAVLPYGGYGHACLNDMNNMEWHLNVPPDKNVQLRLEYTVEYPNTPGVFIDGLPKI